MNTESILSVLDNKRRDSNYELLRVFAMLMIIVHHLYSHCIYVQLTDAKSILFFNNGFFSEPVFFKRLLPLNLFASAGKIGCGIFILLAGFFLVQKKTIRIVTSIKKIVGQVLFASCLLTLVSFIYQTCFNRLATDLIGINHFNSSWWFPAYYLCVVIFAYLYLNQFIAKLNQRQYFCLLAVLFTLCSLGWSGNLLSGLSENLRVFVTGLFFYSLGGFMKRYDPLNRYKTKTIVLFMLVNLCILFISSYNNTISHINEYLLSGKGSFTQSFLSFKDYHLFVIVSSTLLFELSRRTRIGYSGFINFLGASSFMVYLLHDNIFIRSIWQSQDWVSMLFYHPTSFFLLLILWTLITFIVGTAAYSCYLLVKHIVSPKISKLDN